MMATTRPRDTGREATDQRTAKTDPYLEIVYQHWSSIAMLYEQFADKKPVMLFDIQEQLLYALPYAAYRAELTERSQAVLKEQYEQAAATGGVVVFVRDNQLKKLVSFSLPLESVASRASRGPRSSGSRRARRKR
jgi:hypothetical protein